MKKDLLSLLPEELENELVSMGEAKYRAAQIGYAAVKHNGAYNSSFIMQRQ